MENYHVVKSTKSVGIGILLTFLFGPVGLFYSSVIGGIVMIFGPIILLFIFFLGLEMQSELIAMIAGGAFLIGWALWWLICMIWSTIAIKKYNRRIMDQSNYNISNYPISPATESLSYSQSHPKQLAFRESNQLPEKSMGNDAPNIQSWLKENPNKSINDYYIKFKK